MVEVCQQIIAGGIKFLFRGIRILARFKSIKIELKFSLQSVLRVAAIWLRSFGVCFRELCLVKQRPSCMFGHWSIEFRVWLS